MLGKTPLFSIGSLEFHAYGLCMAIGIICCFAFLLFTMTKKNFNDEAIDKILIIGFGATAFGIFMAMVFQAMYDYINNPSAGFDLSGSMTFQGGLIGGVASFLIVWNLYVFVIAPRCKSKILSNHMNATLSDALPFIPPAITIAHAFGRLGCTFAGCCHGAKTDAWYGMYMYINGGGVGHGTPVKVVPTQLFECIFLAVLSAVMIFLYFKFKFNYNFALYAITYGIWRFGIEFARDDYRGSFIGKITPSQFWSIIMVILGIGYIFLQMYLLKKFMKHPELQPPVRVKKQKAAAGADGEVTAVEGEPVVICDSTPQEESEAAQTDEEQAAQTDEEQASQIDEEQTAQEEKDPNQEQ